LSSASEARTDEELMIAYTAGDQRAFDELFRRLGPVLLRVMRRQLSRPEDARDLVQQTFLHLHRARKDFDASKRLRPWVFTIAINLKREYFRRKGRRPEAALDLAPEIGIDPRGQERADAQQTLGWAMQFVPDPQREVILLHWFAGLSFPEVAETVGSSLSAVKVRAHRGYGVLRKVLGDANPALPPEFEAEATEAAPRVSRPPKPAVSHG
jgi:RNA polymerase sigma factor (sigma-70 family)